MSILYSLALLLVPTVALGQEDVPSTQPGDRTYAPYPEQDFPDRAYTSPIWYTPG